MQCLICHYVYDSKVFNTCPSCAKHAEAERARAAPRGLMSPCAMADCAHDAFTLGLCLHHFDAFMSAPESARVRTAVSDWVRRGLLEAQHGGKDV